MCVIYAYMCVHGCAQKLEEEVGVLLHPFLPSSLEMASDWVSGRSAALVLLQSPPHSTGITGVCSPP